MATYTIKRGSAILAQVEATGTLYRSIMVMDRTVLEFRLPTVITFKKGDTVEVYGQMYKINQTSRIARSKDVNGYSYSIEFEAPYYDLGKWYINTLDQNNELTQKQVYVMSDARVMLQLVVDNANRVDSGWSLGTVDGTDVMQHSYSSAKLLNVLQDLADKYDNEFWFSGISGKTINFSKRTADSGISLSYGAGNGLYELYRDKSSSKYFNRLIIQGGTANIPFDYGYERLQLPPASRPFLTANADGFDIVEESVMLDNVYPSRIGIVSSVGGSLEVFDSSLDFDINDHLSQSPAKIAFVSGQLSGFTFIINDYVHAERKISFNLIDDDPAYPIGVPNAYLKAEIGDKYVLLDIEMPQSYVDAAEAKLLTVGNELVENASKETYSYGVSLSPKWLLINSPSIILGNTVRVSDTTMSVDEDLRILGFERDLQEGFKYNLELGNVAKISPLVREATRQSTINNAVTGSGLSVQSKVGTDTLDSVSKRGKTTSQVIEPRGVVVSDIFAPPTVDPNVSEMQMGKWYMSIKEAVPGTGTPPVVISKFIDLSDVDYTGRQQDYVVYWDAATAKHKYKAASFAPSDDVYTKSQINNFFSGVTTITGYNKDNWDMAFGWGNHAGLYQPLENQRLSTSDNVSFNSVFSDYLEGNTVLANDIYSYGEIRADGGLRSLNNGVYISSITGFSVNIVSPSLTGDRTVSLPNTSGQLALVSQIPTNLVFNDGGTYNLNISGSASKWNGTPFTAGNIPDTPYFVTLNAGATNAGYSSLGQVSASLGVNNGSTLNNNISGSAMYWGGNQANFSTEVGSFSHLMGFEGGVGKYGGPAKVKAFLGLPTSGAYDLQWITSNGNTTTTGARFGGKLTWGNGLGETSLGEIYNDAALGTVLIPKFGSSFDFSLTSGNGSTVFQIPTGTLNAIFNGNVGIGISPISKLTVNGNISAGAGNQKIYYDILENYGSSLKINAAGGLPLLLQNDGSTVVSVIGGNVGIGTNSPGAKLEVNGSIYSSGNILANTFGGYSGGNVVLTTNTSGVASLLFRTALSDRMIINSDGNVGIGTNSPGAKFDVAGDGRFSGAMQAPTVWATNMLVVPKVDPVVSDMPVGEWVLRIREVV